MVSSFTITSIIISILITIGTPIALFIIFRKRFQISIPVLLIGAATFFIFAQMLEGIAHNFILFNNGTMRGWAENPWLYMLYAGLMAGIFEETGRFVVMKYALKTSRQWKDGLSFGLGHGGAEAIVLVGLNSIIMLVFAFMINSGSFDALFTDNQMKEALTPIKEQLTGDSGGLILLGGIERLAAMSIQLGLSILVMYAIVSKQMKYFIFAILIHAVIDFPVALYQVKVIENIYVLEALIVVFAVGAIVWIAKSRKLFVHEK